MNQPHEIIQNISLTEKAQLLCEKENRYFFRVTPSANKLQIKVAVEQLFKTKVVSVNTSNYAGKKKRERTAAFGRKANWKRAIVRLKDGEKIDLA
jgi:large subunit ribosomal protein L23